MENKESEKEKVIRLLVGIPLLIFFGYWTISSFSDLFLNKPIKEEDKCYITLSNFNEIKLEMNYEDIRNIVGCDGILMSESEIMLMYYWYGKDSISNANFTFIDGQLTSKNQIGLK